MKAKEALDWGLANELVDGESYLTRAIELAAELGELPPHSYRLAKIGLQRGLSSSMENEFVANTLAQSLLIDSDDFKQRLSSLMKKNS